ncbi:hypothetical protein [Oscillatoria salina]|uniref:hypothetical protein n=1 Tax=Oscillatoria salina TaxID=331517 RepID=UPI0013B72CAB|nr:hypothetical protein [Oscillatoria salina]MBZ8178609.1 hypothetical protein [Oscillatoria salina IIICB1]NET90797.1 hypothetical protein [Kamptonema sp. SIO1D9]
MLKHLSYPKTTTNVLIIEFLSEQPVGIDRVGVEKIQNYLHGIAQILNLSPHRETATHLSEKYGLSAWLPLIPSSAIHAYVWDDRQPSFVSIDICLPNNCDLNTILNYTKVYFGIDKQNLAYKMMGQVNSPTWRELDNQIWRQRLNIFSPHCQANIKAKIASFLNNLCEVLEMKKLNEPLVENTTAWMHWETSGCIVDWSNNSFNLNIYTCKKFFPADAVDFTVKYFNFARNQLVVREY